MVAVIGGMVVQRRGQKRAAKGCQSLLGGAVCGVRKGGIVLPGGSCLLPGGKGWAACSLLGGRSGQIRLSVECRVRPDVCRCVFESQPRH